MYYRLEQKISESYVDVKVPSEIKRGCINSEFQFLDHKEMNIELEMDYGTDFPDLIIAEDYVPLISSKLKRMFDTWGIDNLYYKKMILNMSELDISETFWLALPPRIDCLDSEGFDEQFKVYNKIIIKDVSVGNYNIFKLLGGDDEIVITEKLKKLLEDELKSGVLDGIIIKNI